ncbi:MAG TPA: CatB-related O-acetyltransferase [Methylophilaceae bacterium]|jgi:acetyltransferase-like isoleucine patch superfamily enzyme
MKKVKKYLRKIWYKLLGRQEPPKVFSSQAKFREHYPQYQVGIGTYGFPDVHDWGQGTILKIGAYCSIARNVQIFLGGNHRTNWISSFPFPKYYPELNHLIDEFGMTKGNVVIGNDVWLGRDCTILSGITIGHGAVVGTGAVVTKDVAPYSIVGGNPAKHLRWRFDEDTRKALLETAWWDWPEDEIRQAMDKFCSDDIAGFIDYANSRKQLPSAS